MKFLKPVTLICLFSVGQVFAAEVKPAAKPAAKPAVASLIGPAMPILRISAIDGKLNPNHKKEIQRRAGQKVSFSADFFVKENGKLVAQKASPQDFIWSINSAKKECDPARAASCKGTDLEVTKDGVSSRITHDMFDNLGFNQGIPATRIKLTLKVTYAKNKKLSDSIVILDQEEEENAAELDKALKDLEESQHNGLSGFFSNFFSGSSTHSTDDEPAPSYSRPSRNDDCSPYDATPSCPGRDGHRGGGYGHDRGNGGYQAPSYQAPSYQTPSAPNYGHQGGGRDRDGDGQPDHRGNNGGRGNWNHQAPAAPAYVATMPAPAPYVAPAPAYVAPIPAPVVVAPAPAPQEHRGGFGGGRDRDGDGQPDAHGPRGVGGRDRDGDGQPDGHGGGRGPRGNGAPGAAN